MSAEDGFTAARAAIYAAHDEDPNRAVIDGRDVPYETHYAQRMEHFLGMRAPGASPVLRLAACGQHFRRWEVPRADYPMTRVGYHAWRTHLKKRQAELVAQIVERHMTGDEAARCRALIEKEGLRQGEEEVQVLEDVACLVFLDDQFDEFKEKHDADKIVNILKKTWGKMSREGHDLALQLAMTDECRALVERALSES